ncbi:uncharacterized protein LOC131149918 [Malania oleifera]|uniref:uncharacterized protein LOC131149918 n=1 Tax=Malania oleifera TaxID=397392 RepID=UPI0025ADDACD|nr:uncharacterized protein LOC131149918 [Malania oleifera]
MDYQTRYQEDNSQPRYECLLFDVDDTLYPLSSGLSTQCTKNIEDYLVQKLGVEKNKVSDFNHNLYKNYGTTLAGLRAIGYKVNHEDYHRFAHGRLPYDKMLKPDPILHSLLLSLPIRKVIFSNSDEAHVAKVLRRLGLEGCFEGIICFETLNPSDGSNTTNGVDGYLNGESVRRGKISGTGIFDSGHLSQPNAGSGLTPTPIICKPFQNAFEQAFEMANINPQRTLFFDDSSQNIETGKLLGLHTVLVGTSQRTKGADYALESIHNIREALPELWEASENTETGRYPEKIAIETSVIA